MGWKSGAKKREEKQDKNKELHNNLGLINTDSLTDQQFLAQWTNLDILSRIMGWFINFLLY